MILQGYNEAVFKELVEKPYYEESQTRKNFRYIILVSIFIVLIGLIGVYESKDTGSQSPIYFFLIIFAGISALLFICSLYISRKYYREIKSLMLEYDYPDEVEIYDDFHIEIRKDNGLVVEILSIDKIIKQNSNGTLFIEGEIYNDGLSRNTYEMMMLYGDMEIIMQVLDLLKELKDMEKFENTSLKSILHMKSSQRNELFINELLSAQFLLPIRKMNDHAKNSNILHLFENLYLEYAVDKDDNVCVYTSKKEISEAIRKSYPKCLLLNYTQFIKILFGEGVALFQETEKMLLINPESDRIQLTTQQLRKLLEIRR